MSNIEKTQKMNINVDKTTDYTLDIDKVLSYMHKFEGSDIFLSDEEKSVALDILKNFDGIPIIRATKVLNFCLEAIKFCILKVEHHQS